MEGELKQQPRGGSWGESCRRGVMTSTRCVVAGAPAGVAENAPSPRMLVFYRRQEGDAQTHRMCVPSHLMEAGCLKPLKNILFDVLLDLPEREVVGSPPNIPQTDSGALQTASIHFTVFNTMYLTIAFISFSWSHWSILNINVITEKVIISLLSLRWPCSGVTGLLAATQQVDFSLEWRSIVVRRDVFTFSNSKLQKLSTPGKFGIKTRKISSVPFSYFYFRSEQEVVWSTLAWRASPFHTSRQKCEFCASERTVRVFFFFAAI